MILIQASLGEVLDKISILELKKKNISNSDALANVLRELDSLNSAILDSKLEHALSHPLFVSLSEVNGKLWIVEDDLRELEAIKTFGANFVALARSVYRLNDLRAEIKRELNIYFGSTLREEKSYQPY